MFSWLFNRTFLVLLGLAIVAALVFYTGPLVAIGTWRPLESLAVRLTLIGLIFATWLALRLWSWWRRRTANAALLNQLAKDDRPAGTDVGAQGDEEVAELRKRFESALATLKKSSSASGRKGLFGGFGRQYIYQMPWYVFIGAPGSGKTTALVNSGLEFPLADKFGKSSIRGIGGTRNCDWWFTNEAVLIDTAGRYTTQESNLQLDKTEWEGFLALLRNYRSRAPINGVMLTISVSDLLGSSPDEREQQASAIRRRLTELQEQLQIRFPVYAVVTKVDLLAGFNEYFARLTQDERAQVWGLTFPTSDDGQQTKELAPTFQAEYRLLEKRIEDALPDLLQAEPDVQRRALIYAFTQQFSGLRDVLGQFLETLFAESKFAQRPFVRGVYFTSGTQEGTPFDRVLGSIQRRFGIEARVQASGAQGTGKSYFLKDLLQKLVFAEAHLVGRNPARDRRQRVLQVAGIATCVVALIGAAVAWTVSYSNNQAYLDEIGPKASALAKEVQAAPTTSDDYVAMLPILNGAKNLAASDAFAVDSPPLRYREGLYQGFKMRTAADAAYDRLLEDLLFPRVALQLAKLLKEAPQDDLEALYGRLKAYLMLYEPEHYRPEFLVAAVSADWQASLGRTLPNDAQRQLLGHLRQLLDGHLRQSPFPRDSALITQARQRLGRYTQAQRLYGQLKGALAERMAPADFNLVNAVGPDAKLVFVRASRKPLDEGVSGVFTRAGYRALQERLNDRRLLLLDETWVIGGQERSASAKATDLLDERLLTEIRQRYLTEYRQAWDVYLADLRLVPAADLAASIQLVQSLSAPNSPLPKFIKAVADETTLSDTGRQAAGIADRATEAVKEAGSSAVQRVFGSSLPARDASSENLRSGQIEKQYVDGYFEAWRRLAAPPTAGGSDVLKPVLNDLYTTLLATEAAVRSGNVPPQTDTATRVRAEAGRLPVPLRGMLESLVSTSSSQVSGVTRTNVGAQLNAAVGDPCRAAIRGRYPFSRTATVDVPVDDFARLFAAGGLIDDFFQKNLAPLVDTSKRPWSFRNNSDGSAAGGSGSLAAFQHAAAIRDAFFRGGGRTPQFSASIRVLDFDPATKEVTLDVGGQSLKQVRGVPDQSKNFVWPAPDGGSQVRLQLDGGQTLRFDGPWALHHLFDQAKITGGATPERFTAGLNLGGRGVTLEVVAGSVQNPFRLRELELFNCPGRL